MHYVIPGWATQVALAATFFGLLMALALCIPLAVGALSERRWPDRATGALVVSGAVHLCIYAGSQDSYYSNPTRRWDAFSSHRWLVVAAVVCTAAAVIALIAGRKSGERRPSVRAAALVLAAASFGLQIAGYFGLTVGH